MVQPKKHLGQHFLTDPAIAGKIVDALPATTEEKVLEIGPGTGILTGPLMDKGYQLTTVEIDPESVEHLLERWPSLGGRIIQGDFLKVDLEPLLGGSFHVIGNFPYHISSQIFFRILEYRASVRSVVCMLQKEVAQRIIAPPGSKTYGILSVLLQAYFDCSYLFTVKPGSFHPPPAVQSGVIRLERNDIQALPCNETLFFRLVKTLFNQRRKMIRNSIRPILLNLDGDSDLLSLRPEQLGVGQFIELCNWVDAKLHGHD
jgi:16S rRNA (adenine1518-N6/adenine1519-N6)-dimethyltransferase